jgi:hypothetical protein
MTFSGKRVGNRLPATASGIMTRSSRQSPSPPALRALDSVSAPARVNHAAAETNRPIQVEKTGFGFNRL